jgi:hypothetical protein
MSTQERLSGQSTPNPQSRTKGEIYEGIAFTFCKAATIILLTQRFALPVAAGAAAAFYILADIHSKKDTRCILKKPWLIAGFWGTVCVVSLYVILRPMFPHGG